MFEKLRTYILPHLIPQNAKVLVAVSGGPDSMALSHILWRYTREEPEKQISLVLTHVNHGVRKESDDEEKMVQKEAAKWGIPCIVHRFDSKAYAKMKGQSYQEAAREWRYARWKEDMREKKCTLLATAHHLGDQAETILYRLLRGSGTTGLAGIYPKKGSIIRPLLTFSKADILDYCIQESLPYAVDCSNQEPVYDRNRIRLKLIPELEKNYNHRIQVILGHTGEILRWDEDYIVEQVEKAWEKYYLEDANGRFGLKRDVFNEPAAILSRLLRKAAKLINHEPRGLGFVYVSKIMKSQEKIGWTQNLPGVTVRISEDGVWFSNTDRVKSNVPMVRGKLDIAFSEITLDIGQWYELKKLNMEIGLYGESENTLIKVLLAERKNKVAVFCKDFLKQLPGKLVCRTRREGDKMWFKSVGHKSIKKVFQEKKIAVDIRSKMPLMACGNEVLWIPGVCQSDCCRSEENKEKVYGILKPQA